MKKPATFSLLALLAALLFCGPIWAQNKADVRLSGTVIDSSTDTPVIGAAILVKGTTSGTTTDLDGNFSITTTEGSRLIVRSIGYNDYEFFARQTQNGISVKLTPSSEFLEDVVVVGYGAVKKENLSGAVDQIGADKFIARPVSNATQMLQGTVANLNITLADGKPGRTADYNVRGATSIGGGGSALVLIDGVEGDPALLNPSDIESVSVLKDASSAAVYGSRAPYGVVLIQTKDPSKNKDKFSISYGFTQAFSEPSNIPDIVDDGYVYAAMFYDGYKRFTGKDPTSISTGQPFSTLWLEEFRQRKLAGNNASTVIEPDGTFTYFGNTNYYDYLYKNMVTSRTHNVSMSGNSGKISYYFSGRAYDYDGLFQYNPDVYSSKNIRGKAVATPLSWLKITENMEYTHEKKHIPFTGEGSERGNMWRAVDKYGHPCQPPFNPDGTLTWAGAHSIGGLVTGNNYEDNVTDNFKTTTGIKLSFLKNRLTINADFTYLYRNLNKFRKSTTVPYSTRLGEILYMGTPETDDRITEAYNKQQYLSTNEYIQYEDTFKGKHYFKAMVGYNYEQRTSKTVTASRNGLMNQDTDVFNFALGDVMETSSSGSKWRVAGLFARVNYAYDDRYLLEFDARYDGSSKFPGNSQWGFFPSGSAAWRISQEPWWKVTPRAISALKIRASYGELGNGSVSPYSYQEKFSFSTSGTGTGSGALMLDGKGKIRYTGVPTSVPKSLTWETSKTVDAGLDISFLNGKIELTADWYQRKTLNMFTVGPTLAATFGVSAPKGNYADMTTRGWEIVLGYNDAFNVGGKPFKLGVKATLADSRAFVDKYFNPSKSLNDYYAGQEIGEIWGFEVNRLFQTQDEIDNYYGPGDPYVNTYILCGDDHKMHPGDPCFEDLDGDKKIGIGANTADKPGDLKIIGNSSPRFQYSFSLNLEWNGIYASAFFRGVGKQQWYPTNESQLWGQYTRPSFQVAKWQLGNYWTEDNRDAYLPRYAAYYHTFYVGRKNTRYLQDISYLKLQNLQVGYHLPEKILKPVHLSDVNIFFSGENLWTWSPFYRMTRDYDVTTVNQKADTDITSSAIACK